jgi:hypothetical protein
MLLTIHNRALLRGVLAGAVILGGVSACSRSDRADAGGDTTQTGVAATTADTQVSSAAQPAPTDTAVTPAGDSNVAAPQVGTSTPKPEPSQAAAEPSAAEPAPAEPEDSAVTPGDQGVSGYQAMGHETQPADSVEIAAADTAEPPMARDTSVTLAQGDTGRVQVDTTTEAQTELAVEDQPDTVTVVGDSSSVDQPGPRAKEDTVSLKADSLAKHHEAAPIRPAEDSTEVRADTTEAQTELAVEDQPDTVTVVGDSAWVAQPGPRAEEDSTEVLGQVTEEEANYDVEAIGDANGEPVGAAQVESTGNIATGADAVALLTREGQPCRVEDSRDVQWDMAGSPATLNPCGSGTMTLPKVQTGENK